MADSFGKKERQKKKLKKKQDKLEKKKQRMSEEKSTDQFVYLDEFGNFTDTPPDLENRGEVDIADISISTPKDSEIEAESNIKEGIVKFYNEDKNFGFIAEKGKNQDYFVHGDNCIDKVKDNSRVTFESETGPKGCLLYTSDAADD